MAGPGDAPVRFLAFYLPQYHPTPENDQWWGEGFTEWTNVDRARPLFEGHQQPHLPAELGRYDLRDAGAREAQAGLARQHGIDGFVYYHYWFAGRRLLQQPLDEVLSSGAPDFPFCLCWANENWTRAWDGREHEVLLEQTYSPEDDLAHIAWLAQVFRDPRYIRVDGKPLFLVYRAGRLPDARATAQTWRDEAARLGIGDLYLARVENFPDERGDATALGFDASVEFQPDWLRPGPAMRMPRLAATPAAGDAGISVLDYPTAVALALTQPDPPYKRYRCVTPGFDSSPRRRSGATIFTRSTPDMYAHFVRGVLRQFRPYSAQENFVFVNAWNEWGEGNHLEPDQRWGRAYLEAHLAARAESQPMATDPEPAQAGDGGSSDSDGQQTGRARSLLQLHDAALAQLDATVAQLAAEVDARRVDLTRLSAELEARVGSMAAEIETLVAQLASLSGSLEERTRELEAARSELDSVRSELAQAQEQVVAYQRSRAVRLGAALHRVEDAVRERAEAVRRPR